MPASQASAQYAELDGASALPRHYAPLEPSDSDKWVLEDHIIKQKENDSKANSQWQLNTKTGRYECSKGEDWTVALDWETLQKVKA